MEEDDDDFYDPADAAPVSQPSDPRKPPADAPMNDSNDAEEEEVEEEEDEVSKQPLIASSLANWYLGRIQYHHRGSSRCTPSRSVRQVVPSETCIC